MKLLAATIITIILLAGMALVARLIEKTDWLIFLVIIFAWIVGIVYCSL